MIACRFPSPAPVGAARLDSPCFGCPELEGGESLADPRESIASFAAWVFHEHVRRDRVVQVVEIALQRRERFELAGGRCVPKLLLGTIAEMLTIAPDEVPSFSDRAREAFLGAPVASWPDGAVRSGPSWTELAGRSAAG